MNSLFAAPLVESKGPALQRLENLQQQGNKQTTEITQSAFIMEENGVKMKLTVIDTPGFGDQVNNDGCWEPILKYIKEQVL